MKRELFAVVFPRAGSEVLTLMLLRGICVVPASGFGQKEGRVGFRTTFLPPEDVLNKAIVEFKRHHELFCEKYASLPTATSMAK